MHIVEYVTRSSTKDERTWNMAKGVQAPDNTEMTSEPNQVLESQPTTNKNSQNTTQSTQYDNEDIAIDFLVKKSKGLTNCLLLLKRKQALTGKQQAVKQMQEQLQAHGQPIEPVPTTKLPEVLSKPIIFHLMDDNDLNVQVKHESVKEISTKESVFGVPSIKLCTIFQILQKSNLLVWKKRPTVANMVQE